MINKDFNSGEEIFIQPMNPEIQGEPQGGVEFEDKRDEKAPLHRKSAKANSLKKKKGHHYEELPIPERPDLDIIHNPSGTFH